MPVTPLTTEARAVEKRMRAFANIEGNAQCLVQLVYHDSKTLTQLIPVLEGLSPAPPQPVVQGLYQAMSTCGTALEGGGNVALWPLMTKGANDLDAALDLVEA